ncbi:MAG: TonB-dependent receptor [Sulfurimonas sp.]|nr:TonB-dependent receptor [Sulfurimonas sp.]
MKKIELSFLATLLATALCAQNQYALEKIDVVASQGTTLEKKDVTDSVIVITKEAIEESRVTTLADALSRLGNIAMTQSGGAGQNASMFVRGMDNKRTVVLIDGVRYNDPTTVSSVAQFEHIMLSNVERIEIIKGAQSGVWGADASGAVINIVTTKAAKGLHGAANVEYGSFETKKSALEASYKEEGFDFSAGGSYYKTDGFSATEPKQSEANYGKRGDELGLEDDGYKNKAAHAKAGFNLDANNRLEFSVQTIDALAAFDSWSGASGDSTVPQSDIHNRFYTLAYKLKSGIHDATLSYNRSTFDRVLDGNGWSAAYKGFVDEVKVEDSISYMKESFLRLGASYGEFAQEDVATSDEKKYSSKALFATNYNKLALLSSGATIVTESLRFDDYDSVKNSLTGKFGVKQYLKDDIYLSTNIGTGFNVPTLDELYGAWGSNPNLEPEKSLTLDLTLGDEKLYATLFQNQIRNMIEYDMNTWSYVQSSGESKFRGVEVGYKDYFAQKLGFEVAYTYLKTKNPDGDTLARRPKHQVDAKTSYYITDDIDIGINAHYIGVRYDSAAQSGAQTGKYIVANFVANAQLNRYATIYGKIDNITDKYYQLVDGYATAERSFFVGLHLKY